MNRGLLSLAPALVLVAYFLGALALFAERVRRRGLPVDEEISRRATSLLLGRWIRHYLMWVLAPYERLLVRLRVPPDWITWASLAAAIGAGWAIAVGRFALGGWLYLGAGICDILDGRIARATSRMSSSGAYFDSVIDRYSELAVFSGLAVYYRATPVLGLVLIAAIGSLMVSYARARGEGLGVNVQVGTMQRAERLFYLGVVIAHSPIAEAIAPSRGRPLYWPTVIALALIGFSSNLTAVRRILHTRARLESADQAIRS